MDTPHDVRAGSRAGVARAADAARVRANEATGAVRTLDAAALLGPSGLLRIDLDGALYTLRLTRNRRLILTK